MSCCIVSLVGNNATDILEVVGLLVAIIYGYLSPWDTGLCPLFCNGSCTFPLMKGKSSNQGRFICELSNLGGNSKVTAFLYGIESLNGICNLRISQNDWWTRWYTEISVSSVYGIESQACSATLHCICCDWFYIWLSPRNILEKKVLWKKKL